MLAIANRLHRRPGRGIDQRRLFQVRGMDSRRLRCTRASAGRVEIVKALLYRDHREFAGDRTDRPAFLDDDQMVGLLEARQHRRRIQRTQRAQVDDLGVDPLARQLVGGLDQSDTPIE